MGFSSSNSDNASVASTVSTCTESSSRGDGSNNNSKNNAPPKPMPMAIMRNAHEVIRGAMADIQKLLDEDNFEEAQSLWHKFHRFSDLHMQMEEGRKNKNFNNARGLFHLVDEYSNGAASKAELRDFHSNLYELEEDVVDVFLSAPDIKVAKEIYPVFHKENLSHLLEEESILMPAIQKMMKSGVNVRKYIVSDILPVLLDKEGDMEFFIRFSNEILEKHEEGKPRVRVFDHALWALSSSESQWQEWNGWIQDTLSVEKYEELQNAIMAYKKEKQQPKKQNQQQKNGDANVTSSSGSKTTNENKPVKLGDGKQPIGNDKLKGGGFFKQMFNIKS